MSLILSKNLERISNINEDLAEDILKITINSEEAIIFSSCKKSFLAFLKQKLLGLKYCPDKACPPNPLFST